MKTTTLIQAQANVMKLTTLTKGDTVKVLNDSGYSGVEVYYGVVLDVLNTGEKTFFQILKYKKSYGDISASIETYSGEKDISIFPATPEEVGNYLKDSVDSIEKDIEKDRQKLQDKIDACDKARQFIDGEMAKELKAASFTEVSQSEFEKEKLEKQRQIEALSS